MTARRLTVALFASALVLVGHAEPAGAQQTDVLSAPPASTTARQMTEAAVMLIATMSPTERDKAMFPIDDPTRSHWSNVPFFAHARPGFRRGDMSDTQALRLHDLLRASLSSQGYQKVAGIMRLDDINHDQLVAALTEASSAYSRGLNNSFGSSNYSVAFFGDPRTDPDWGWILQGHHMAASFTVADGRTAFLPLFLGATPLALGTGAASGWSALSHEITRGFELLNSLTPSQRSTAWSDDDVPADVLNGVGHKDRFTKPEGLQAADMTAPQQRLLRALVMEYVRNADFDAAETQLDAIEATGWDRLRFSWRGATVDADEPFYYRVQSDRIVIELVQSRADHIHTIVRDPGNDYGEAWLGLNYAETITAAERSAAARTAAEASERQSATTE
jgi:hypothetical protein